jgi:predicted helicase
VKLLEVEGDWQPGKGGRTPNLNPKFIEDMSAKLGLEFVSESAGATLTDKQFTPEDVFHYAYAVFHSPTYRERYAEFLKIDFPRLPLTSNVKLFRALCANGSALVDLHLARGSAFQDVRVEYSIKGANEVAKTGGYPKFTEPVDDTPGRVYINRTQYFEGIALETWDFQIGGYQVLHKWLKDRRGRVLSFDDIRHYTKIVRALDETQRLMSAIDDLIPGFPIE